MKNKIYKSIILLLCAFYFVAMSQTHEIKVIGLVVGTNDYAAVGATVELYGRSYTSLTSLGSVTTDAGGEFSVNFRISEGYYKIGYKISQGDDFISGAKTISSGIIDIGILQIPDAGEVQALTVTGKILDEYDDPVNNAQALLFADIYPTSKILDTVFTDESGEFLSQIDLSTQYANLGYFVSKDTLILLGTAQIEYDSLHIEGNMIKKPW